MNSYLHVTVKTDQNGWMSRLVDVFTGHTGDFACLVTQPLQCFRMKGSDASWEDNNEPPAKVIRLALLWIPLFAHLSPRLVGELIVYRGIRRPPVVNIFKRLL